MGNLQFNMFVFSLQLREHFLVHFNMDHVNVAALGNNTE